MWHMRYPLSNGQGHLTVSTTRPETMLGDCAVAVNPEDERYRHMIGELVELPLTNRRIPIIADEHADPEFGTGCVKITPAHDFNDYEVWLRHRDEKQIAEQAHGGLINIFTVDAAVRANDPDEDELIPRYTVGKKRAPNPEYGHLRTQMRSAWKRGDKTAAQQLDQQRRKLPSGDTHDPNYRRLKYVRYVDDVRRRQAA